VSFTLAEAGVGEGSLKSTVTGETSQKSPIALGGNLLRGKIAPGLGLILEAWTGVDFKGAQIDRTDWRRWLKRGGSPLAGMDIYESLDADGIQGLAGTSGIVGGGVTTYELPRWPELDAYYDIGKGIDPEDPLAVKRAKKDRKSFRSNPNNEAKLFIRGKVTTLSSDTARNRVQTLMAELKVNPKNVPGYRKVFGNTLAPSQPGHDAVLPTKPPARDAVLPTKPNPSSEPASRWLEVRPDLKADSLAALNKVWFGQGRLTRPEERELKVVFEKHPFGQTNFNTWMKQTLRQIHEVDTLAA
jgi:hypothetical protein